MSFGGDSLDEDPSRRGSMHSPGHSQFASTSMNAWVHYWVFASEIILFVVVVVVICATWAQIRVKSVTV